MSPELAERCKSRYGERWWLGLAREISALSGSPARAVERSTLRWARGEAKPPAPAVAAIVLLTRDLTSP